MRAAQPRRIMTAIEARVASGPIAAMARTPSGTPTRQPRKRAPARRQSISSLTEAQSGTASASSIRTTTGTSTVGSAASEPPATMRAADPKPE
jgi:hypothetical protein